MILFPWWCSVLATIGGFWIGHWGWSRMRDNLALPRSEVAFWTGMLIYAYGFAGIIGRIAEL